MFPDSYNIAVLFAEDLIKYFMDNCDLHWLPPFSMFQYRNHIPTYFTQDIGFLAVWFSEAYQYQRGVESSELCELIENKMNIFDYVVEKATECIEKTEITSFFHFCAYVGEVSVFCERKQKYMLRSTLINAIVSVMQDNFNTHRPRSWNHYQKLAIDLKAARSKRLQEESLQNSSNSSDVSDSSIKDDENLDLLDISAHRCHKSISNVNTSNDSVENIVSLCEENITPGESTSISLQSNLELSSDSNKVSDAILSDHKLESLKSGPTNSNYPPSMTASSLNFQNSTLVISPINSKSPPPMTAKSPKFSHSTRVMCPRFSHSTRVMGPRFPQSSRVMGPRFPQSASVIRPYFRYPSNTDRAMFPHSHSMNFHRFPRCATPNPFTFRCVDESYLRFPSPNFAISPAMHIPKYPYQREYPYYSQSRFMRMNFRNTTNPQRCEFPPKNVLTLGMKNETNSPQISVKSLKVSNSSHVQVSTSTVHMASASECNEVRFSTIDASTSSGLNANAQSFVMPNNANSNQTDSLNVN